MLTATVLLCLVIKHSTRVKKFNKTNSIRVIKQKSRIVKPKVHKNTQGFKIPTGLTTLSQFRRLNKHVNYQEESAEYLNRSFLLSPLCVCRKKSVQHYQDKDKINNRSTVFRTSLLLRVCFNTPIHQTFSQSFESMTKREKKFLNFKCGLVLQNFLTLHLA